MKKIALWSTATFAVLLASLLISTISGAQQRPDIFANPKNLKVLPKGISSAELRNTMRSFALGLGVRCSHCHQGEEGKPLSTYDFPSDEKETKRIARKMLKMVSEINETVTDLDRGDDHRYVEVNCITCHRGQDRPRLMPEVLSIALAEADGNIDAVIETYRGLRDRYYGTHTFDFSEFPVNGLAFRLLAQERVNDSIALFKMNAEYHPDSSSAISALGRGYEDNGQLEKALDHYQKALELNPENGWAKRGVKTVEKKIAAGAGD